LALQDRTEPATGKRREEVRKEGRTAKSAEINAAVVLLVSLLVLRVAGPYVLDGLMRITRDVFGNLHTQTVSYSSLPAMAAKYGVRTCFICLPLALAVGAVGVLANVLQVGFMVTTKPLAPDLKRLDPFKGISRLFSGRCLVELLKSGLKVGIVIYVVYAFLRAECPHIIELGGLSPAAAGAAAAGLCWRLLARACAAMIIIAVLDYMYQRISFENSIKMTKQEVKDEYKQTEGNPLIKGQIRKRQREIARRRMMQEVPKADVVVTNPTHIAVALKYDPSKMSAPTVVAKGQRLLAERIKALAEASGVPIVENAPVARLLYKLVEIGGQIPGELYQAVAEILAFVYRLSEKAGRARASYAG